MEGLQGSPLLVTDEFGEAHHSYTEVEDGDEESLSHGCHGQIQRGQACMDDAHDARQVQPRREDSTAGVEFGHLFTRRRLGCLAASGLLLLAAYTHAAWHNARQREGARAQAGHGRVGLSEINFELLEEGSCKSHGYHPINDLFYCEAAAMDLGLADLSAIPTEFPGIPEGCYYFQDKAKGVEGLWLGTNEDNKGNGAQTAEQGKTRRPICSMAMPSTTTMQPTTSKQLDAAQGSKGFKIGDVVKIRDNVTEPWEYGFVTSVDPLKAKPYGWHKGFAWKVVEHIDLKSLGEELAAKKHGASGDSSSKSGEVDDSGAKSSGAGEKPPQGGSEKEHHAATSADKGEASTTKGEDSDKKEEDNSKEEDQSSKGEEDSSKEEGEDHGKTHGHKKEEVKDHDHKSGKHEQEKEQREKTENAPKEIVKGISYAPVPSKHPKRLDNDDFMSENTAALWGSHGRGDLAVIRSMGANVVRLYGNDPQSDHKAFLDEAHSHGLGVILGFSDYPYIQMQGNCISTHFDCYSQIKEQFAENLRRGFLDKSSDGKATYHPALRTVIIMNEPDLKFFPISEPWHFCKALVSAFDAVLDAEREAGVDEDFAGPLPNFTATFSFAVCAACKRFGSQPAVAQMWELRKAMEDPSSVGYQAKNDLWSAYHKRFMNSFNTANPARDIRPLFLNTYDSHFQGTPVFIGEYHAPAKVINQHEDLQNIVNIAKDENTLLAGLSFFEFQVRYDKGGSELMFGMFGLGEEVIDKIRIGSSDFTVRCLTPMAPAIEQKATPLQRSCGLMESGVEYVVDAEWTSFIAGVRNPDECCTKCKDAPRCKSWTWNLSPIHGLSCVLNGAAPEDEGKLVKESAVSGFPPPREMAWKEENTFSQAKALVPEALTEVYGGKGIEYSKLCPASKLTFFMYA